MAPEKNPAPQIIDGVPSQAELAQRVADGSLVSLEGAGPQDTTSTTLPHRPLAGPRETGSFMRPDGATVIAEVTGDGMKQSRVVRERFVQDPVEAKERYNQIGRTTPEAQTPVERGGRVARIIRKIRGGQ